jgi:hypothetical protein
VVAEREWLVGVGIDYAAARQSSSAFVRSAMADIDRLEARAAAAGSRRGQPQALASSQRTQETRLLEAVGAGDISRREAVELRREIRALYEGIRRSIVETRDAVARDATHATRIKPGIRGGDAALVGGVPTNAELDNLEKLLRDRDALNQRLQRSAQGAGMQREYGLRAGLAEEHEFKRLGDLPGYGGVEKPSELRAGLSHVRRKREVEETLGAYKLRNADRELEAQEGALANEYRKRALQTRASSRKLKTADDLAAEAQELKASREQRYAVERMARAGDEPQGFVGRLLASTRPGPGEKQSPAQFIASKAITTGSFALSGGLLYGGIRVISDMVKQAEELQRLFSLIDAQFKAIGKGSEFAGFRREVLAIARDSGVAADEVATVAFQMRGAFEPTEKAIKETAGAIRVALVTGIEQRELTDSLTAASIAYGVSIEDIGDKAIGLEERFGVLSRESLKVFGDMATSAKEVGLSLDEVGAIVGVIQQRSARGGAAIAEGLGRVLPAIASNAVEIARLYENTPALNGKAGNVLGSLAAGETGQVLLQLVRDYNSLDKATQSYVITLLGGRREAQLLIPLFAGAADVIEEVDRTQSDAGKTADRYAALQDTLARTTARFKQELLQLGDAFFRAGLGDALQSATEAGGLFLQVLGSMLRVLADINDATGGNAAKFLLYVGAINLATRAYRLLRGAALQAAAAETAEGAARGRAGIGSILNGLGGMFGGFGTRYTAGAAAASQAAAFGSGGNYMVPGANVASSGIARAGQGATSAFGGGLAAVGVVANQQRNSVRQIGKELADKIARASDARLREVLATTEDDFWEQITTAVAGTPTGREAILGELRSRSPRSQELQEKLKAYIDMYGAGKGGATSVFPGLLKQLEEGGTGAVDAASAYVDDPTLSREMATALKAWREKKKKEAADAAATAAAPTFEKSLQSIEEVQAAFESGEAGYGQLIAVQRQQVTILEALAKGDPEKLKQLLEARRALAKSQADAVAGLIPILGQFRELSGGNPFGGLADITSALAATAPGSRTYQDAWEAIAPTSAISDPRQRAELAGQAAGIQSAAFRKAIAREGNADAALAAGKKGMKLDPTVKAEWEAALSKVYERSIVVPGTIALTDDELRDLEHNAILARVGKVNREAAGSNSAVIKAQDALKAAQIAAFDATLTDSQRDAAVIGILQAQRELDQTVADQATAHSERVIAELTARGDEVAAARERLRDAQRKVDDAPEGLDQGARDRLDAAVISAQANLRDTDLANRERDIDVALQLERISTAQAIQQLEALLNFPNITKQQTEELLLKIKSLRDQAASDFNLNLGDIKLPTLYEVRRMAQSNDMGMGYNDNRNVQVTLYVTNGMTEKRAQQFISEAVGAPVRVVAPRPRAY